ncbi:XdhC family protein [Effusibacillus lacus]|uniref:Xanthine dehydrogenase n=1 Tax=Effusibacillus lacus TaxID=1348429 RepID=A0A292YMA8_9BACL|nr:XdhC family protein [Effusibacillus lacus]TCS70936.1 xanthine/CO dehydrogenase XdhC/CoxF family maturation factor [Effusibacillus lacus]GAX90029.1 hypothetical protein EFBL_1655 [Effusibacillus lacus]
MLDILNGLQQCFERKERAAVATVLKVEGSAYRREGARCLILETGSIVGTLSGGCVEGDLIEHAREVINTGIPEQIRYDFRPEGDLLWGLGVGCNGALTIWLQPFDPVRSPEQAEKMILSYRKRVSCSRAYLAGMVVESKDPLQVPVGTETVLRERGERGERSRRLTTGLESAVVQGVAVKLFIETVKPRPRLVIFGAGPDAVPLVRGAKTLNWHVSVVDHRQDHLNQPHFMEADKRVAVSRGEYSQFSVNEETYVVVMTHNYELDRILVGQLLSRSIPYLGVLGSRQRIERMLQKILFDGVNLNEQMLEKLHSPVGLDIGAESPEEIALSILSELVCRKNGRNGQSLKFRKHLLHVRATDGVIP